MRGIRVYPLGPSTKRRSWRSGSLDMMTGEIAVLPFKLTRSFKKGEHILLLRGVCACEKRFPVPLPEFERHRHGRGFMCILASRLSISLRLLDHAN